jgi:hypothetical protein
LRSIWRMRLASPVGRCICVTSTRAVPKARPGCVTPSFLKSFVIRCGPFHVHGLLNSLLLIRIARSYSVPRICSSSRETAITFKAGKMILSLSESDDPRSVAEVCSACPSAKLEAKLVKDSDAPVRLKRRATLPFGAAPAFSVSVSSNQPGGFLCTSF